MVPKAYQCTPVSHKSGQETLTKCHCEGIEDAFNHSTGHYTITVHEDECPKNPENWTMPDYTDGPDLDGL